MVVTVDLLGDEMSFLLGSREITEGSGLEVYSEKSPLGTAIMGKKVGESATYAAPNGKELSVKVLNATPYVP
jgi:transcription elongation factor GreA